MLVVRDWKIVYTKTKSDVLDDFRKFCDLPPEELVERGAGWTMRNASCPSPRKLFLYRTLRTGQLLSEFFHWPHRVRTSTIHKASAQEVLNEWRRRPSSLNNMHAHTVRASPHTSEEYRRYRTVFLNSALYTVSHWRASVSKHLCATTGAARVLDFSAGWGDRLTGFLASDSVRHITLVDPRPGSIRACKQQYALVRAHLRTPERSRRTRPPPRRCSRASRPRRWTSS